MSGEHEGAPGSGARKLLGVVGTLVWDRVHQRDRSSEPFEEWGGIAYAFEALEANVPPEWDILPIVKVGADLEAGAREFFAELPRVRTAEGLHVVTAPNPRVELRFVEGDRRMERLTGGVPPWGWLELAPLVRRCDAVYVNFISGFEMELDTAQGLRDGYRGPLYADLHSLFLAVGRHGDRIPRRLPAWQEWLRCFDAVQMNEAEFELLSRREGDPWALAARVVGPGLGLMTITLGDRGAAYVAAGGFRPDPSTWERDRSRLASPGPTRSARVPPAGGARTGDATGCGDVWGATTFARLLAGDDLEGAMKRANEMAARNVEHRGARGLWRHLKGRLSAAGERP